MHTVTTVVVVATHHQQHHSIGMFTGVYEFIRIVPCKQIHRCYMYDSSQTIAQPIYIYIYTNNMLGNKTLAYPARMPVRTQWRNVFGVRVLLMFVCVL